MRKNRASYRSTVFAFSALRDLWSIWLALAVLTTLPYIAAALRTPKGYMFTGVLTAYDDTFTYLAWMRQSAAGHLLMCDLFTSEPHTCEFFLPLWNILGFIAGVTGMPIALTFHAARLLAGLLLLMFARAVAFGVMKSRTRVRYSLWLYAMSGGFGWLVYALKNRSDLWVGTATGSVDLDMPEAIAFRSVFAQVHFAVGAALVFGSVKFLFDALVEKKTSRGFIAGAFASLLAVVHPYMVVVVCAVAGAALLMWPWLIDRSTTLRVNYRFAARAAVAFGAAAIPGGAYLFYLNRSNEVLREWLRVTDTLSPAPWQYALGFGLVAALAMRGFRLMWSSNVSYGRLLLIWTVAQAVLLYAPLSFQRRLVEGLQLPLSIAASVAVFWIAHRIFKHRDGMRYRKVFLAGVVALASITNVGFVAGQMAARGPASGASDPRRYLHCDLVDAFEWLRRNAEPDAILFSSYLTGNLVPSMTGLHVFLGHYGQTIGSDEKGARVSAFYTGNLSDQASRQLFAEHRVGYVIYGPFERAISDNFTPPRWLELAHRVGDVEIFAVAQ